MNQKNSTRRDFIKTLGLGYAVLVAVPYLYGQNKPQQRPNIIFILADDMGYGDVKCLNPDSKIPTPNLDKMAKKGITFTDAHSSSSLCSPTRYGIMTGRYSWRSSRPQGGALSPYAQPLIESDRLTLSQYLKNNGYHTACFGKWHLGMNYRDKNGEIIEKDFDMGWNVDYSRPIENGPNKSGFDYYFGVDVPNYPPYCFIENDRTIGV